MRSKKQRTGQRRNEIPCHRHLSCAAFPLLDPGG
jgi:hypothetical protein